MSNPTEFGTNNLPDLDKLEALMASADNLSPASSIELAIAVREALPALIAAARRAQREGEAPQAVGEAGPMPGTSGFTMACFKAADVPVGTKLYSTTLSPLCGAQHASSNIDWLGLALDLESQAKRVTSQTAERAMQAGANGLRLFGSLLAAQQAAEPGALEGRLVSVDVSAGDDDYANRIFAELTGETGSDGTTLIAIEKSRNFSAPGTPEAPKGLDLSRITSVVLQDRGSKSVIVRCGQSMAAATKFLDQFGTLVLSQRAAQLDGGQEGSDHA